MTGQEAARSPLPAHRRPESDDAGGGGAWVEVVDGMKRVGVSALAGLFLMAGGDVGAAFGDVEVIEPTSSVTVQDLQRYDGFEDYAAQGQQMENSDVGCFANECKRETASCFTDGSCLKVFFPMWSSLLVSLAGENSKMGMCMCDVIDRIRFQPKIWSAAVSQPDPNSTRVVESRGACYRSPCVYLRVDGWVAV